MTIEEKEPPLTMKMHFHRMNERVQNKYLEMQRKIAKSKSYDSLFKANDDLKFKKLQYASTSDLLNTENINDDTSYEESLETDDFTCELKQKYKSEEEIIRITDKKLVAVEIESVSEFSFRENEFEEWEKIERHDSRSSLGMDSLLDLVETPPPITPSRTIRKRIESKLLEVKERRARKIKEKEMRIKEKSNDAIDKLVLSNSVKLDIIKIPPKKKPIEKKEKKEKKEKTKVGTVIIALINATGIQPAADDKFRLLHCRFRLGGEKCKSKVVKCNGTIPKWQELLNLTLFDDSGDLEIVLYDKDITISSHVVELFKLEKEKTHKLKLDIKDKDGSEGKLFILLTISGVPMMNIVQDMDDVKNAKLQLDRRKQPWYLENHLSDVGWLSVIVYGARGLAAQDCYCVLKLGNDRVQTITEYKTNEPVWMKIFFFQLSDITSILEVSVVDEKKLEEVGKVLVPLLRIKNGEQVWYALKDQNLRERAKGQNPRILLEMQTRWNFKNAAFRVINPKEQDFMVNNAKFDRRRFARNLARTKVVINWVLESLKLVKTCFEWESRKSNLIAIVGWVLFCYFFKVWMVPLLFLVPFIRHRIVEYQIANQTTKSEPEIDETKAVAKVEKEEKTSLRQKLTSLQEMVQTVQNGIGKVASLGESVKNLCNFTVPFVSWLAVFIIIFVSFLMYVIPLKYILILWGINKFTRKFYNPNRIPNSEILDLLSRVPDDETLLDCEQLALETMSDNVSEIT